jgi:hypothetical protein
VADYESRKRLAANGRDRENTRAPNLSPLIPKDAKYPAPQDHKHCPPKSQPAVMTPRPGTQRTASGLPPSPTLMIEIDIGRRPAGKELLQIPLQNRCRAGRDIDLNLLWLAADLRLYG